MSQDNDQTHTQKHNDEEHQGSGENQLAAGSKRRFGVVYIPVNRLREHIILSSIVALFALTLFVLSFVWDQFLWMAAAALPLTIFSGFYALFCLRALRQADLPD